VPTKPGFSFLGSFCVVVYFGTDACLLLLCSFSVLNLRDWLGRTSPKWPILCRVGRKSQTQSTNPV